MWLPVLPTLPLQTYHFHFLPSQTETPLSSSIYHSARCSYLEVLSLPGCCGTTHRYYMVVLSRKLWMPGYCAPIIMLGEDSNSTLHIERFWLVSSCRQSHRLRTRREALRYRRNCGNFFRCGTLYCEEALTSVMVNPPRTSLAVIPLNLNTSSWLAQHLPNTLQPWRIYPSLSFSMLSVSVILFWVHRYNFTSL